MSSTSRLNSGAAAATATLAYGAYDNRLPVVHETLGEMVSRLAAELSAARIAKRERAKLAGLDEHLLVDLGFALDEIPAVRTGEQVIPRSARHDWRSRRRG